MKTCRTGRAKGAALLAAGLAVGLLEAAPVARDTAYQVAVSQLPGFYPGSWQLSGEYALESLSGETQAFIFMFSRASKLGVAGADTPALAPTSFVARTRSRLKAEGRTVNGHAPELYGESAYASIVISADDAEPPVLRCFQGLPAQVVKEEDALALVAKKGGAGSWRVSRRLMLGMFDEAFCLEDVSGAHGEQVADMRSGAVLPTSEALSRAPRKQAAADDAERVSRCQAAWREAVAQSRKGAAAEPAGPVRAGRPGAAEAAPAVPARRPAADNK